MWCSEAAAHVRKSFACSRPGSWPREPGLWFFLSVPQPHALSLSSDADEEISVLCALTQGDQTHWSAFSRRQSLSLVFLLCKCLFPFFFFFPIRCPCLFSSRNLSKSVMPPAFAFLSSVTQIAGPMHPPATVSSPRLPAPAVPRARTSI